MWTVFRLCVRLLNGHNEIDCTSHYSVSLSTIHTAHMFMNRHRTQLPLCRFTLSNVKIADRWTEKKMTTTSYASLHWFYNLLYWECNRAGISIPSENFCTFFLLLLLLLLLFYCWHGFGCCEERAYVLERRRSD